MIQLAINFIITTTTTTTTTDNNTTNRKSQPLISYLFLAATYLFHSEYDPPLPVEVDGVRLLHPLLEGGKGGQEGFHHGIDLI
jgi:hypothetical protein